LKSRHRNFGVRRQNAAEPSSANRGRSEAASVCLWLTHRSELMFGNTAVLSGEMRPALIDNRIT
jgi:hypothetical protein